MGRVSFWLCLNSDSAIGKGLVSNHLLLKTYVIRIFLIAMAISLTLFQPASAQTLTTSNVRIEWNVQNRFRFFRETQTFREHERAWRQYLLHISGLNASDDEKERLRLTSSVLGTEHVLNDRYIPFSQHVRQKYDPRGWAARHMDQTCWNQKARAHSSCDGIEQYVSPQSHVIDARLKVEQNGTLISEYNCLWRVNDAAEVSAPCDDAVELELPYPNGGTIFVRLDGEQPIGLEARVKDLLVVGLGDSFASGEGNPDVPAQITNTRRFGNLYPTRLKDDVTSSARWLDELCHRSLYSNQMRTALQIAIENPKAAVTFLGFACSGAAVDDGILGPQAHMTYASRQEREERSTPRAITGGKRDTQMAWLLRELCIEKPQKDDGLWVCPGGAYRRNVDLLLLSVAGNDIGFSSLVAWSTLRQNTSSRLAGWFGATTSAKQFANNVRDDLPGVYARLAKAIETGIPLRDETGTFDPSRVILSAYPDILADETGAVCRAGKEDEDEDLFPANQSLDFFASWLVVTEERLNAAHKQLASLHRRIGELAGDHGWTFAARAYEDQTFRGHGFCAQDQSRKAEATETLIMPCWGKAPRETATCESNWSGKERSWRPYDPGTQNYPYALRQRWVRSFNDAYLVVNEKVIDRDGRVDGEGSRAVFSETTAAMHPTAEGHAAMADAVLIDLRTRIEGLLGDTP